MATEQPPLAAETLAVMRKMKAAQKVEVRFTPREVDL
jgi:hypothetical protein